MTECNLINQSGGYLIQHNLIKTFNRSLIILTVIKHLTPKATSLIKRHR